MLCPSLESDGTFPVFTLTSTVWIGTCSQLGASQHPTLSERESDE
jgi:hypothetical protein